MAVGADRDDIRRLIVWHGMRLALMGLTLGLVAGFVLTRFLTSILFGVKTWDLTSFLSAPVVLSFVILISLWIPAARAARVDPAKTLRAE